MKEEIGINEIGPQEDFVKFVKPKLQNAPVNAKVLKSKKLLPQMKQKLEQLP